jgi:hypothetical protein
MDDGYSQVLSNPIIYRPEVSHVTFLCVWADSCKTNIRSAANSQPPSRVVLRFMMIYYYGIHSAVCT